MTPRTHLLRYRATVAGLCFLLGSAACGMSRSQQVEGFQPVSEKELAARQLQAPLDKHLCSAAVYPSAGAKWKLTRVAALAGRGPNFATALEALCREADGMKLPAVVDIYYWRTPSGWSPNYELRGTAVRYEEGFKPPEAPDFKDIHPPQMPHAGDEPPPGQEKDKS